MMRLNGSRSEMDKFFQQLVQIFGKSLTLSRSGSKSTRSTKTSKKDLKKRQKKRPDSSNQQMKKRPDSSDQQMKKRLKTHASELKIQMRKTALVQVAANIYSTALIMFFLRHVDVSFTKRVFKATSALNLRKATSTSSVPIQHWKTVILNANKTFVRKTCSKR